MSWYDTFANVYDASVEVVYRSYRSQIVAALDLQEGDAALDLACGTGPNVPHLVSAVGSTGRVVGVDLSEGMLRRAAAKAKRFGWDNVSYVAEDARQITPEMLAEHGVGSLNGVVVALGLSVIPDWEDVFQATWDLLAPGGRYVIFDVYAERWVPQTWIVERVAQADVLRRVWEPLERVSEGFERQVLPGSPHVHGGDVVLSRGTKALG
jgi:ubiquinone/menaquinone biosynthesis C-methylase UbiE